MKHGPDLDAMLCFALYSANHRMAQHYRELLAPWQLTYPQYLVLVALWRDRQLTVTRLGNLLGLDSGTVSPLLKRLEARDLVTRSREASDERVVTVRLTERGAALEAELADVPRCLADRVGIDAGTARALLGHLHDFTEGTLTKGS
ncbi:MarR family winged helix-turn-helix transcriptional regulator [Microlunatus parietis]|uniref:DNA-binding MarR family transcriptional regulator n=1 Tax=Microlunatus parietis TaxID=682979 RepID=A0A7Y9I8A7_9ACTN|nr:MarR family transcriptional regulator [Microlunatus parietis]NYE72168.1 DNA-binding MarR family transcriptional regulator [Microlunatus parietis]